MIGSGSRGVCMRSDRGGSETVVKDLQKKQRQGTVMIGLVMVAFFIWMLESGSDRFVPLGMLFSLAIAGVYKSGQLLFSAAVMNLFLSMAAIAFGALQRITRTYSRREHLIILLLMFFVCGLIRLMQQKSCKAQKNEKTEEQTEKTVAAADTGDISDLQTVQRALDAVGLTELSLEDALEYSAGTTADVLSNIRSYLDEAPENTGSFRTFYEAHAWKELKIRAHALKSTSRIIGAVYVAYLAEQIEHAAGEENVTEIDGHLEELLSEYRWLCTQLERLLEQPELLSLLPERTETELSKDGYRARLTELLAAVQAFDVDFEELRAFAAVYPKGLMFTEERERLAQAIGDFDYERIGQLLTELRSQLSEGH